MILIEFLFAPTVPSAPSPKNTARTDPRRLDFEPLVHLQRQPGHIVDDADREVALRVTARASSSKTAFTIAGVNSLEPRP